MPDAYTYLMVNLGVLSLPLLFSFHPKLRFDKTWRAFFPTCILVGAGFVLWDIWFTDMGVWGFTERYLTGAYLFNLPLEEVLFFGCIPYACTFTYHCLKVLVKKDLLRDFAPTASVLLAIVLVVVAVFNFGKWYTSLTFLLTATVLLWHVFVLKSWYLGYYFLTYLLVTPFFLLTNGILTGSWIEEQVVWYNNAENLGIRVGTIPFEDFVYGFLLLLLVVTAYEWRLKSIKD
ncbi:MAG: lycopene cyclase domain-containing protein [Saprospiraceae bacterium]|nr:lycopene cyclase domain-containing protein [Saprospiraceae bacterium]MCF8251127.1 lycopene cyclase domain-containing protein [Saprospiraceae bacterium]MCF8282961.1 lycopene cyclase domain-containing protein [Bacteroidales bacterium]MCF8312915.1 lycopene cyclase domain-containing protein [Saprospiraceae bacterium]MCF8441386.1 lycopene cyclase domain-containing protein [Saprospiraceae bacterium]